MKPTTPLLLLSLGATSTLARNHNNTSPSSQCHRLARLTSLAALASDPAALAAKSQGDPTRAEELQAKAAAAAPELAALRGNETFVAMCASQVNGTTTTGGGWGGDWDDCKKLEKLREKVKLGVNATTTTTEGEGMRGGAKWAEKLKKLEGNETLVAECAAKAGGGGGSASGGSAGVASPTTGGSGSAESTGSTTGSTTKPPSDTTIISGVSGALEPVGNTLGLLGVVLFGALLL